MLCRNITAHTKMERLRPHRQQTYRSKSSVHGCMKNSTVCDQCTAENDIDSCPVKNTDGQRRSRTGPTSQPPHTCPQDTAVQQRLGQNSDLLQQRLQPCNKSSFEPRSNRCNQNEPNGCFHLTRRSSMSTSTSFKTVLNGNTLIFYFFILCCLIGSVYSYPATELSHQSSKPDSSKRTFSMSNDETDYKKHVSLEGVRNIRSALTPPVKQDKTTPTKREISAFLTNSHREPQRLASKSGFYVEIKKNGKVKGTRRENAYSIFELISIQTGIVAIKSKKTGRYLAMDNKGRLRGLKIYTPASDFHESLVENNFFVFYKEVTDRVGRNRRLKRHIYLGFDNKGRPKRGKKIHRNDSAAHFQKLKTEYPAKKRKRTKPRKKGKKASKSRKSMKP